MIIIDNNTRATHALWQQWQKTGWQQAGADRIIPGNKLCWAVDAINKLINIMSSGPDGLPCLLLFDNWNIVLPEVASRTMFTQICMVPCCSAEEHGRSQFLYFWMSPGTTGAKENSSQRLTLTLTLTFIKWSNGTPQPPPEEGVQGCHLSHPEDCSRKFGFRKTAIIPRPFHQLSLNFEWCRICFWYLY